MAAAEGVDHLFHHPVRRAQSKRSKISRTRRGIPSFTQRGLPPVKQWAPQQSELCSPEWAVERPWDSRKALRVF